MYAELRWLKILRNIWQLDLLYCLIALITKTTNIDMLQYSTDGDGSVINFLKLVHELVW